MVVLACASTIGSMHGKNDILKKSHSAVKNILDKAHKLEIYEDHDGMQCMRFYLNTDRVRPNESDLQYEQKLCRECDQAKTSLLAIIVEPNVCEIYTRVRNRNERRAELYQDFIKSPEVADVNRECKSIFKTWDIDTLKNTFPVNIEDKK